METSSSALKASNISGNLLLRNSQDALVSGCVRKLQTDTLTAIITGKGLDKPPHPKSVKPNLQTITRDIFQTTTSQLMTPMPSPILSYCRLTSVDKVDELCSTRLFFNLFDGNTS